MTINLGSGGTIIAHGWDRDSIHVRAQLGGRDWRETAVQLDWIPGAVRLLSELKGSPLVLSTSHTFEIWLPHHFDIDLESCGGDVWIDDLEGRFRGQTRGGAIVLDRLRGDAALSTRGGPLLISNSDLEGLVTTRGGSVQLVRVRGGVRAIVESDPPKENVRRPHI